MGGTTPGGSQHRAPGRRRPVNERARTGYPPVAPSSDLTACPGGCACGRGDRCVQSARSRAGFGIMAASMSRGPHATAARKRQEAQEHARYRAELAALGRAGPWPADATVRTEPVQVIDVDVDRDLAVVVSVSEDDEELMLHTTVFRREDDGWRPSGGGGGSSGADPLTERETVDDPRHIVIRRQGWQRASKPREHNHRLRGRSALLADGRVSDHRSPRRSSDRKRVRRVWLARRRLARGRRADRDRPRSRRFRARCARRQ